MNFQVHPNVAAMFSISVISVVDDGARTCFWTDRWLHGQSIKELAPTLIKSVPKRALNCRTVRDAVHDLRWVRDIQGALSAQALFEYFLLLDILDGFQLSPGVQDQHCWTPSASGAFSSKSAYKHFFLLDQFTLNQPREYGSRGHLQDASFLFGWHR